MNIQCVEGDTDSPDYCPYCRARVGSYLADGRGDCHNCGARFFVIEARDSARKIEQLKPCPFCGSPAELYVECDMVWARCSNDDCQAERICKFDEQEDAIENWNKRA